MRVVSRDGCINVPYEGNMFCLIHDEEHEKHEIVVRTPSFTGYMELASYDTLEEAKDSFEDMAQAGAITMQNTAYYLT